MKDGRGAKGICMRCGFAYRLRDIVKEWTGAKVCPECLDPKPVIKPPSFVPDGLIKANAAPEPGERHVTTNEITRAML